MNISISQFINWKSTSQLIHKGLLHYLDVCTMKMFKQRIDRFRNTALLFDHLQQRQNLLPVMNTSAYVFPLIIKRIKSIALKKVGKLEAQNLRNTNDQIKKIHLKMVWTGQNRISSHTLNFPNTGINNHLNTNDHSRPKL